MEPLFIRTGSGYLAGFTEIRQPMRFGQLLTGSIGDERTTLRGFLVAANTASPMMESFGSMAEKRASNTIRLTMCGL